MTEPHLEHSIFGGHHHEEHAVPEGGVRTRAEARRRRRPPRRRTGRRLGILVVAVALVAAAAFAAYTVLRPVVDGFLESNDDPGPGTGTVKVAVNGTLRQDWTLDAATGLLAFATAPAPGAAVTAGFEFDVPVRFDTDAIRVQASSFQAGEAPAVPVVEVRA